MRKKALLTKKDLEEKYLNNKQSITKIASELKVASTTVYSWLKKYNIPIIRKQLISIANKGKPKSLEHRKKISIAKKGKKLSEKTQKKISLVRRGKHHKKVPNKEEMHDLYWKKRFSTNQIAKMYNVHPSTIRFWMRIYGIKIRNNSEAHKGLMKGHWKGDKNPSKRPEIKAKISRLMKERWRDKNYRRRMLQFLKSRFKGKGNPLYGKPVPQERRKLISTKVKEFFKEHPEIIKKIKEARRQQRIPKFKTKPEQKFLQICKKYSLPFKFTGDGSFWIGSLNPDFVYEEEKVAVDIFGDYWHKNAPFQRTESGRKIIFERYGWKLIVIWEHELMKSSEGDVLKKIRGEMPFVYS